MNSNDQTRDRVKENTPKGINEKIKDELWHDVERVSANGEFAITQRIHELDKEWDIERYLGMNMSIIALASLVLAYFINPWWLILTAIVLAFFFEHSVQGWCPPLPIFRAFKVRTRKEIDQEKYALKAIRGDFATVTGKGVNIEVIKRSVEKS